jgi:hypothetical protein
VLFCRWSRKRKHDDAFQKEELPQRDRTGVLRSLEIGECNANEGKREKNRAIPFSFPSMHISGFLG